MSETAAAGRVLAPGQWLGLSNRVASLRASGRQWVLYDSAGGEYRQRDFLDGLRTWDEKTSGGTWAPYTPWPPLTEEDILAGRTICGVCKTYFGYRHPRDAEGGEACLDNVRSRIREHEEKADYWRDVLARRQAAQ